ncbi:MAG: histidine phosphatase family protein [Candidatus Krumholzibacteriota bacterium]|nr:histidine phosphatase family protein [Candidatus Krumholzibacteriota bacterium]
MLLYLIRHGQTDWNRDRRIMGRSDVPLNAAGREMVAATARWLGTAGIPVVYSSTVPRAMESARILAGEWEARIVEEPRLDESAYERWVGRRFDELAGDPDFEAYRTAPTRSTFSAEEGMADIQRRALAAVRRIVEETGDGRAALVSHSDVMKPVVAHYLGMDLDAMHRLAIANASVSMIDFGFDGGPRLRCLNVVPWRRFA